MPRPTLPSGIFPLYPWNDPSRLVGELWQRRGCAVLLVTHDVEEAVLFADRVLMMDNGVIAHEQRVDLDRPRDIADPRFAELRAGLLERLGVDTAAEAA